VSLQVQANHIESISWKYLPTSQPYFQFYLQKWDMEINLLIFPVHLLLSYFHSFVLNQSQIEPKRYRDYEEALKKRNTKLSDRNTHN